MLLAVSIGLAGAGIGKLVVFFIVGDVVDIIRVKIQAIEFCSLGRIKLVEVNLAFFEGTLEPFNP